MGSTFFSLHYHFVFSTKDRRPLIHAEWRPRMHSYLGGIIRGMNGVAEIVGGVDDHVHLLASLRPVHRIADVMRDLKKDSTKGELRTAVWVARRIRRLFSKSLRDGFREGVHREPRSAPSQVFVR